MLSMMLFLAFGILMGFLLKKEDRFVLWTDRITTVAIYLLLFLLGVSVGIDHEIMNNIFMYGYRSLVLCLGAIAGSVVCSYFVYASLFNKT